MPVIVGLWNPEVQYERTRHNVGAEVVEVLARRWDVRLKKGPLRVRALVARTTRNGRPIILALPMANMNVSGGPVRSVLKYFKEGVDDLLVVHDDIDLPFARLRLQRDRGAGGHNGIKSVAQALGTRDFHRLKIGVGRPPGQMDPASFVLKPFSKSERPEVDLLVEDAADVVERFIDDPQAAIQAAGERRPSNESEPPLRG